MDTIDRMPSGGCGGDRRGNWGRVQDYASIIWYRKAGGKVGLCKWRKVKRVWEQFSSEKE